jgi:hypothetical protein
VTAYPPITAVGTGRVVDVANLDRPAAFLCFAQATQHEADPIEAAIRAQYTASQVLVAHVVDLHGVPGMLRGMAERILQSEYEKAVAALPAGEAAEDYVVILPDWDGAFVKAMGFAEDVSKRLGVAVFGRNGTILGKARGDGVAGQATNFLQGDS